MILGSTVKTLARQVPGYRIVSPGIARRSVSLCTCKLCVFSRILVERGKEHLVCDRVYGRLDEDERGHGIVAWNGSCDRAEFRKDAEQNLTLEDKEAK